MSTEWHDNALHDRRQWLGDAQPRREDSYEDAGYAFTWGPDSDAAIAAQRARDPAFDAIFVVAEQNGITIVPAYVEASNERRPHSLMELAYSCDDADWVIVTQRDTHAAYTADVLACSNLSPSGVERHDLPRWCVFITHHA
jgi:hypothetical protein